MLRRDPKQIETTPRLGRRLVNSRWLELNRNAKRARVLLWMRSERVDPAIAYGSTQIPGRKPVATMSPKVQKFVNREAIPSRLMICGTIADALFEYWKTVAPVGTLNAL